MYQRGDFSAGSDTEIFRHFFAGTIRIQKRIVPSLFPPILRLVTGVTDPKVMSFPFGQKPDYQHCESWRRPRGRPEIGFGNGLPTSPPKRLL